MRRTGELLGLAVLSVAAAIGPAAAQVPPKEFVNFEGAQTNPIRLSSDGTRLFALNTPDTRVSGVFKANRRVPSEDKRMGFVWAPSKLTNSFGGTCAAAGPIAAATERTANPSNSPVLLI